MRNVYEPLVHVPGNPHEAVPALAEYWEVSEDGKTYVFKLNGNARFHSGTMSPPNTWSIRSSGPSVWPRAIPG